MLIFIYLLDCFIKQINMKYLVLKEFLSYQSYIFSDSHTSFLLDLNLHIFHHNLLNITRYPPLCSNPIIFLQ